MTTAERSCERRDLLTTGPPPAAAIDDHGCLGKASASANRSVGVNVFPEILGVRAGQAAVSDETSTGRNSGPDNVWPSSTRSSNEAYFRGRSSCARWNVLANTKEGGCAKVQRNDPDFPTELCRRLPSTG
jgi:hypothetical protein